MANPRILLVDDHKDVSRMLRSSIELSGWECTVIDVSSAEDAMLEVGRGPVDLVVSDIKLPGMSGIELVRNVRKIHPEARAILITGHSTTPIRKQVEELGVVALLKKPIGTSLFLEAVASVLRAQRETVSRRDLTRGAEKSLLARLNRLCADIQAAGVLLIDDYGRILAQAGWSGDLDIELIVPSLSTPSSAGLKVSNLLGGMLPGNLHYYEGAQYNLFQFSVGAFYQLVVILSKEKTPQSWDPIILSSRRAADDVLDLLATVGVVQVDDQERNFFEQRKKANIGAWRVIMEDGEEITENELDDAAKKIEQEDAEKFWDQAADKTPKGKDAEGDILTYDEALDKGILPDKDA
jgi:CheY-like chemotaxis protein